MRATQVFDRKENDLTGIAARNDNNHVILTLSGTAGNEDEAFLRSMLDEVRQKAEGSEKIVIDVCSLDFCYSQCVRALFEFSSTDSHNRPALHYAISKNAWQVTSLRAMVGFSPNCTISECYISGCRHVRTTSEDQNYFAPTGSGSIVTTTTCLDCGHMSKSTEYFD